MNIFDKVNHSLQREKIARTLDLTSSEQKEALRRRLRAMERDGQLMFDKRLGYQLIDPQSLITGVINIHPAGFGFVASDASEEDLYLAKNQLNHVFDGDVVQLVTKSTEGKKAHNQLIKVIEHKTTHIAGELTRKGNVYYLVPDNAKVLLPIEVDSNFLLGAKIGQNVNTKIVEYPDYQYDTLVEVTEVLGCPKDPGMEIKLALRRHGIADKWDNTLLAYAKQFGDDVKAEDKASRVDYRQLPFVTIDGSDAKDFDDAIYCEKTTAGDWRLLVAIADVSHYIKPGDALDVEAQSRATSIYFPGHVVPMLPHSLSDGLCSLKPKVDRLVMVCDMTINLKGKVVTSVFTEGVIHSHARLTYDQANAAVTTQNPQLAKQVDQKILPHLQSLYHLYQALSYAREKRGAIEFSSQEQCFNLTEERKIASMSPIVRNVAHRMVEEFMLCANVATATFLNKHKIPTLFRVHSAPQQKKLALLRAFLDEKGLSLGGADKPTPDHYNQLMNNISQRSDASTIQTMLLRSQSRAQYSVKNEGHFGLAYAAYGHFTSPIRRYPDLLVHRAIRAKIRIDNNQNRLHRAINWLVKPKVSWEDYPYAMPEMTQLALHCTKQSQQADEVSREVESWLKCQYIQQFSDQNFNATISNVTSFGLFVEIDEMNVEGLVHISNLPFSPRFIAEEQCISSDKKSFMLGDKVKIRLNKVDLKQRKIDFLLG